MAERAVKCFLRKDEYTAQPLAISCPEEGECFKERLFVDLCDVADVHGNRDWWHVAVDQHTDYTVIAPCPSHESQAVVKKIFKHWTRWSGPPDALVWEPQRFSRKNSRFRDSGANHHQGSGGQDDFATPGGGCECHVCRQLRSCPRTEPKGREAGLSPSDTFSPSE